MRGGVISFGMENPKNFNENPKETLSTILNAFEPSETYIKIVVNPGQADRDLYASIYQILLQSNVA